MGGELSKPDPPPTNENGKPICIQTGTTENLVELGPEPGEESAGSYFINENALKNQIETMVVKKNRSFMVIPTGWKSSKLVVSQELFEKYASEEAKKRKAHYSKTIPKELKDGYELKDFLYHYNEKEELRHIETGERFYYITERHYIAMGEAILTHIQERMKNELKMAEVFVDPEKTCNIFLSPDYDKKDKLMILCQGSGAVRAGQWARALCFNDSLKTGACIEYIKQAYAEGYGVIVLNPNQTSRRKTPEPLKERYNFYDTVKPGRLSKEESVAITNSGSGVKQACYVYDQYVKTAGAKKLFIVAHSYGGWVTLGLLNKKPDILNKLKAVGFTDAVHSISEKDKKSTIDFVAGNAINWVTSKKPLDSPERPKGRGIRMRNSGCTLKSAGTESHEMTSSCCQKSLFNFLKSKSSL